MGRRVLRWEDLRVSADPSWRWPAGISATVSRRWALFAATWETVIADLIKSYRQSGGLAAARLALANTLGESRGHSYLSLLALCGVVLMLWNDWSDTVSGRTIFNPISVLLASLALALVVARQMRALSENRRHANDLVGKLGDLERRVVLQAGELTSKTDQLFALNHMAMQLSACLASAEVPAKGLELATEVTGLSDGALWLGTKDGRVLLAACRGLSAEMASFMSQAPELAKTLTERPANGLSTLVSRCELAALPFPQNDSRGTPVSALLVPLTSRGRSLGAMVLFAYHAQCSEADLRLAEAVAAHIGVTIENARRYEQVRELADHDSMTGLLNHRAFFKRLEQELVRAQRSQQRFSLVAMDIDYFKLFNDTYGHSTGDLILRSVADALLSTARTSDVIARSGGDEFVAILPDTDAAGAAAFAERYQAAVAQRPFVPSNQGAAPIPISLSFGIATYPDHARDTQLLMAFADANMYESKQVGGGTITGGLVDQTKPNDAACAGNFGVLEGLVTAVDHKDHYTRRHSEDVASFALALAQGLGVSEESERILRIASLLHDVGKVGVPDHILRKPGPLEPDEIATVQQHALLGEMIIKEVPNLEEVLAAVGSHHERIDGKGYPRGLAGDGIPLFGRILAVADAYSAMTSDRPYRVGMGPAQARAELLRVSGKQLDPALVAVFVDLLDRGLIVRKKSSPAPAGST